jgi:hypothetical protein
VGVETHGEEHFRAGKELVNVTGRVILSWYGVGMKKELARIADNLEKLNSTMEQFSCWFDEEADASVLYWIRATLDELAMYAKEMPAGNPSVAHKLRYSHSA